MIYKETDQTRIILYENTISAIDAYMDILAEKRNVRNVALRPTQKSLRGIFKKYEYIRSYLIMNLLSRDLGFEPVFFDWLEEDLFDKNIHTTGGYALHHKDDQRAWSIYIRDLMITSKKYHGFYLSPSITAQDTNIMQEGLNMLIELGVDRYKQGATNWKITDNDINAIFTRLGGGSMYTMSDGRTVLEWWKDGSSTGLKSDRSFGNRLNAFNNRIEFLADNKEDYEAWINKFYPINGPGWIDFGKVQLKSYEWMMENLKHLHYHVHLEDVDFLRKVGSI